MSAEAHGPLADVLGDDQFVATITQLRDKAGAFTHEQLSQMGADAFDAAVLSDVGMERALVLTEALKVVIGDGGLTPLNGPQGIPTVEGFSRLHAALVQAARDGQLAGLEIQVRAAELEEALQTITSKRQFVVEAEQARAQAAAILAQRDAAMAVDQAKADKVVNQIAQETRILREKVATKGELIQIASTSKTADIDAEVLDTKKRAEAIRKRRAARAELTWARFGPHVYRMRRVLIALTLVANLVADTPGREGTFLLGAVNDLWDALYMPIRDGIVNTYQKVFADAKGLADA